MRSLARLGVPFLLLMSTVAFGAPDKKRETTPQEQTVDLSQPLTLENAIKIGLANQNSLAIAKLQRDASSAKVTQARSSYYPSISPTYEYSTALSTYSVGGIKQSTNVENAVAQIGLYQLIYDMGVREENLAASSKSLNAAEYNIQDARQTVISNITDSYIELLRSKELVRVAESSVEYAKTTLDATREFADKGTVRQIDVLQAEADYSNVQVNLIQARNNVKLAETTLKTTMGLLTLTPIVTPDTKLPEPSPNPDSRHIADYMKLAYDNRPDLKRDAANIDSNKHNVKIANIQAGLQINATVSEAYQVDPVPGENRTFITTFTYPLFDAGAARASVREAKSALEQLRCSYELSKQAIQQDVEQAYLTREEARSRISATITALKAAQQNFDAASESQKEGSGDIISVITARNQLVTADTNAVQAIYDYYKADAQLSKAIGSNDTYSAGGKQK